MNRQVSSKAMMVVSLAVLMAAGGLAPASKPTSKPASRPAVEKPGDAYRKYFKFIGQLDKDEMRKMYYTTWPQQEQLRDGMIDEAVELEKLMVKVREKFGDEGEEKVTHAFGHYLTSEIVKVRYADERRDHALILGAEDTEMAAMIKIEGHWRIDLSTVVKTQIDAIPAHLRRSVERQDFMKGLVRDFETGGVDTLDKFLEKIFKYMP